MRIVDKDWLEGHAEELISSIENEGPVMVQAEGEDLAVILPPRLYDELLRDVPPGLNPQVATLFKQGLVQRWKVYKALARWEAEHPGS